MNASPRRTRAALTLASLIALPSVSALVDAAPAAAVDALPAPVGGFHEGVYVPFDDLLVTEQGAASVVANGNLALTWAGSTFDGTIDTDDQLDSFASDIGLRGALTLELAADTAGDVGGTLELLTVPLAALEIGPLVVTPYLGVDVRFGGRAEAGAQLSVVAPFDVGAAFSFAGAADVSSTTDPIFDPEIGLPDATNALAFEATVELELSMTFMVSIEGIPVGGPVLVAALGAGIDVDLLAEHWWRVEAITALKYGWSMPDATGAPEPLERPRPLFRPHRRIVDQADDAGPLPDVSTRWSRAFDIFNDDDAGAVVPAGDELVVVENDANPWVTTLDGVGNPTWQQTQTGASGNQAIARTADGDVLVAGVRGSGGLRVGRFAADGTPDWSEDVVGDGATSAEWTAITPTTGGAIIAGNVRRGTTAVERPTFVALDADGALQWVSEIDPGAGSGDATINDVVATPSGELLAVGTVAYGLPDRSINQGNALILRMNPDGSPVAASVVGGPFSDIADSVAVQPDGSYAISGQTTATTGVADYSWVASFDADDNLLWSSTYADRVDAGYSTATGIAAVPGGDYVVSGTTGMVFKDGWMIRVDATGMPVWSKSYIGADEDELTGVVTMTDGVAAFGRTNTTNPVANSFDDLWVVRSNVDGMVPFDPNTGFDTVNGQVQWSPTSIHLQLPLAPAIVPVAATVTDVPLAVIAANATNTLLTG